MAGTSPIVSVLLPVYNGAAYLREAVQCMLDQTFRDLEIIAIDDGSRDGSEAILRSFDDPRVRVVRQENRGLAATLNRAIELARGELLARQDQDDLSAPERIERQVAFLQANPDCVMVGTWSRIIEVERETRRAHRHPSEDHILRWELLFDNPFVHSSVVFRKAAVVAAGLYSTDKERQPPEDYELWSRLSRRGKVANLSQFLHVYREMPGSMSRAGVSPFLKRLARISAENLAHATGGGAPTPAHLELAARAQEAWELVEGKLGRVEAASILENAAAGIARDDRQRADLGRCVADRMRRHFPSALRGVLRLAKRRLLGLVRTGRPT